jgi:glutathione S-transferase
MTRHPFGKIPAFEHAGFRLYEAGAITRYVDGAFPDLGCNRKMLAVAPE